MKTTTAKLRRALVLAAMILFLLAPALAVFAKGKGFKDVVKHIETSYGAKKTHVPMLGLANFAIKLVRPAGVKGFKLAVFENQDFSGRPEIAGTFTSVMREAYNKDWMPLVQMNSRREGNARTFVYAKYLGKKDAEFAVVTFAEREAVVFEAKFNPDAAARFLENPKLLGISLGDSIRGGKSNNGGAQSSTSDVAAKAKSDPPVTTDAALPTAGDELGANSTATSGAAARPNLKGEANRSADRDTDKAASATPLPLTIAPPASDAIRIETRLVNLNVKAINKGGQPLTDLKPEDFAVYEDGVKQEVAHFKPVSAPVNMILMLDLSGSTQKRRKSMIEAANGFIDALPAEDRVALVAFTRRYRKLADFTSDKVQLKQAIKKIEKIDGGTAFYDALWQALGELDNLSEARKTIVVLTDGEDESLIGDKETAHTYAQLLDRASEEDVTIYPIYFKASQDLARLSVLFGGGSLMGSGDKPREARRQLDQLAEMTGGEVINAQSDEELGHAYARVATELHTLYSLAYSPDRLKHNGEFRRVTVRVGRDGAMARTRRGYYDK